MKAHKDFNGATYLTVRVDLIDTPPFQRDLKESWVAIIDKTWNPQLFRPLTLSEHPDGRYFVLDGQHTLFAAKRRGHSEIPAVVYSGLTVAEEAAIFSDLNSERRKPEAFDLFVSDFVAGRPWAMDLQDLADKYKLSVSKGATGATKLRAVGAMRSLIEKGRLTLADDVLDILTTVYPETGEGTRGRIERTLILGLADCIGRAEMFGVYDKDLWKKKLARASFAVQGGGRVRVTPDGFQSYLNTLISTGTIVVSAMNSGQGASRTYGKAFAFAVLPAEQARNVYALA